MALKELNTGQWQKQILFVFNMSQILRLTITPVYNLGINAWSRWTDSGVGAPAG